MTQDELDRAGHYLNELLGNLPLDAARERVARELADQAVTYDQLTRRALALAQGLMTEAPADPQARLLVQGHGSLLEDLSVDVEQARSALRLLEEKKRILAVLDQVRAAGQMQIFIGSESGFSQEGVSVVAAPYGDGAVVGALGVIGPTRMNYSRVVALVDYTARALGRALTL
jgi:heat-inducible transcriptional repressor